MKPLGLKIIGRIGNGCFQYAYARALAEQQGRELHMQEWEGQSLFQLDHPPLDGTEEVLPEHYHQDQDSLIYSRADCRRWFTLRPEMEEVLANDVPPHDLVAHYRGGDYLALGYPVVSKAAIQAYVDMLDSAGRLGPLLIVEEASGRPWTHDFYQMMKAKILLRANSSFSWWASCLSHAFAYSPIIEQLEGGKEHDEVLWTSGNWPRLANLPGITDLHLRAL